MMPSLSLGTLIIAKFGAHCAIGFHTRTRPRTLANFWKQRSKFEPITIFCIEVNDAAVGGIGIHLENDVHRHTAELGYWLGEEFWARGVMTEAVGAFTDFCFDRFSLRRIYAEPFANREFLCLSRRCS